MAIILLPTGSVYQFTDGETGVYQYAGTHDAFNRTILSRFTTISSSTSSFDGTTTFNGVTDISSVVLHDYRRVVPSSFPTTSLTTNPQFLFSGSFIASTGNANHLVILGASPNITNNTTINYMKAANTSNLIRISSSAGISGQAQWSSSDAWASIQAVFSNASSEWIITSKVGNWY